MLLAELCALAATLSVIRAHQADKAHDDERCWGNLAVAGWLVTVGFLMLYPLLALPAGAYAAWATWEWWKSRWGGDHPSSGHPEGGNARVLGEKSAATLRDLVGRLVPTPAPGAAA